MQKDICRDYKAKDLYKEKKDRARILLARRVHSEVIAISFPHCCQVSLYRSQTMKNHLISFHFSVQREL